MIATLFDISNGGWSAIAAWVGLLLAVTAAIFAYRQFQESQQTRADQAQESQQTRDEQAKIRAEQAQEAQRRHEEEVQPYVAIFTEHSAADPNAIDLVIKNFGATAAKDIHIKIDPTPQQSASGPLEDVKVPEVIRTLVPGQRWHTFWDTTFHREENNLPRLHTATIEFSDSRGRKLGPYTFDLDWGQILDRGWVTIYGMHELAGAVRELRDLFKGWRGAANTMRVMAYSGDEHDREVRERFQDRQREEQQAQQVAEQPPPADA